MLLERASLPPAEGSDVSSASATAAPRPATSPPAGLDPAVRAAALLRHLDRATFDRLRIATALHAAGLDDPAIARTRVLLGLAQPSHFRTPARLAAAWLEDADVRAFLGVHEWDGVELFTQELFETLLGLAAALDRADGVARTSPAIARLRRAAKAAGYRVDRFLAELEAHEAGASRPTRPRSS